MEERRSIAETLKAFFISPFLRLQKVTWRLVVFSILLISIFPRPILLVKKKKKKKREKNRSAGELSSPSARL
ncbi:unnamed protein product [Spirodela intermedia]|uniref:Uncharacterized protein n=1 Tax=Spirodela intermedia TaxID=51605 RepID=A0A7I8IQL9_SPIIN|nr:unnamed protein product [Spirodela intermedia]CAA6660230.1 unnamed protein product [Spirodela intermedia]